MFKHIAKITIAVAFGFVLNGGAYSQSRADFVEIYSNADSSVQFIVLEFGPFDYPNPQDLPVLAGQTLIASDGKTEHQFTFPSNVGNYYPACDDDPLGVFCVYYVDVLVATRGFADLNVVKPDFVVPNEFLFLSNGSVRLGVSEVHYEALPADGWNARWWRAGDVLAALAVNNAGELYSFINHTGLWWAASESGWGVYIAHQGNSVFATWFTYDANGKAWWLTMIANQTPEGSYDGKLYRTNGAPFSAFVPPAAATPVGTGSFFTEGIGARFTYTVNDGPNVATQSKRIVRQTFGPVPTCVWGVQQPDLSKATNYTDLWWSAPAESESGWGVTLTQQGTTIFAIWLTYDANRNPLWLSVTAPQTAPNTFSGALDWTAGPAFGAMPFGPVQHKPAGRATFTFADGNTGTFSYDVDLGDGVNKASQSKAITRQVFRPPGTVCQ